VSGDVEQAWVMVVAHLREAATAAQEVADELDHPIVYHLADQIRLLGHAAYAMSLADESVRDALERRLGGREAEAEGEESG
jgi:hypothetical protein